MSYAERLKSPRRSRDKFMFATLCFALAVLRPARCLSDELRPLSPSVHMPNGNVFQTWEVKPVYTKTYHVDVEHPAASDAGPGSAEQPFKTIGAAAAILQPGERVLIHGGVYREWIRPARGGASPYQMISYEAAPGEMPVIKGSQRLEGRWQRSYHPNVLWSTKLPKGVFEKLHFNPFAIRNLEDEDVLYFGGKNKPNCWPYNLKRGQLYQDGRRLTQVLDPGQTHTKPGQYYVADDGVTVTIRPFDDANPNEVLMEYTVHPHLIKPLHPDTAYIRIKGLRLEQIANGLRRIGSGALFTYGGHHWIIEDNTIAHCGGTGIEFGWRIVEYKEPSPKRGESFGDKETWNIVRGNTIYDCGSAGMRSHTVKHDLVESNYVYNIGWQGNQFHRENAGIKLLRADQTLVRKNVVRHISLAAGIWMDWDIKNSRVTQNIVYDVTGDQAAMILEGSIETNWIDHNIFWKLQPRGYYSHATDNAIVAHNLVGHSTREGLTAAIGVVSRGMGRGWHNTLIHNMTIAVPEDIHIPAQNRDKNTVAHNISDDDSQLDVDLVFKPEEKVFVLRWKNTGTCNMAEPVFSPISQWDFYGALWPTQRVPAGPFSYPNEHVYLLEWRLPLP
ncbi:MAG: hypothetical protein DRP65_02965 [Planctomycetota bacterium]|nr:MAG: hypothetical protein DRP65_02965 [Planctomycetota bacterium]